MLRWATTSIFKSPSNLKNPQCYFISFCFYSSSFQPWLYPGQDEQSCNPWLLDKCASKHPGVAMSVVLTCFVELCPFACGATRHVLMFVDLLWSVVGRHEVCWLFVGFLWADFVWSFLGHYNPLWHVFDFFWNYFFFWNYPKLSETNSNFLKLIFSETIFLKLSETFWK